MLIPACGPMTRQIKATQLACKPTGGSSEEGCSSSERNATPNTSSDDEPNRSHDPPLNRLIEVWPNLAEPIRTAISAIAEVVQPI